MIISHTFLLLYLESCLIPPVLVLLLTLHLLHIVRIEAHFDDAAQAFLIIGEVFPGGGVARAFGAAVCHRLSTCPDSRRLLGERLLEIASFGQLRD